MRFRFRSKVVPLLVLYGLLIGLILPVSALDTVDNGPYDIFEKLTINVPDEQKYVPGEILVKFNPGVSEEKIKNINAGHGTQVTYTSPYAGFKILKIPKTKTVEEMTEIYSKNPNVEYAVPNAIMHAFMVPTDPYYDPYQWNFKNGAGGINLEPAWDISSGEGVIVAVLDTGVAYEAYSIYRQAPDLKNTNFVPGYDFVNNDAHPNDDNSHGTHVAGTIAQSTNNNYGVAGVAYDCSIMPVKVLNKQGSGTLQQLVDGIYFATNNSADVISMSLGYPPEYDPGSVLHEALDYAYNNGITIIAASGNDATGIVSYPAAYGKCIAVGATSSSGILEEYSNYGEDLDIVAPGEKILQNTFDPTTKNPKDFGFWYFSGTSMATPHVSGVAALLISKGANGPDEVRAAIQNTATDLGTSGWDKYYGYGLVDATAVLEYISQNTVDTEPPKISDVNAIASTYSAIITWTTNEDSNSTVIYWEQEDPLINYTASDPSWTTENRVALDGLNASTEYYYVVQSVDKAGNFAKDNNSSTYFSFITTVNQPPVANAGGPYSGTVNIPVEFDGSASSDPEGSILSYEWDFGDGNTSLGMISENTYSTAGTYNVTLNVTDDEGVTATDKAAVTVVETGTNNKLINVSSVEVTPISRKAGKNTFVYAKAIITIVTTDENPVTVEGATVSGIWSGASSDLDSAVTDSTGKVTVYSDEVKYKSGELTFTFTVNDVSHPEILWDGNEMPGTGTYSS